MVPNRRPFREVIGHGSQLVIPLPKSVGGNKMTLASVGIQ